MKLNTGNKIKYNNLVYEVIAVIFSTVYLCPAKDSSTDSFAIFDRANLTWNQTLLNALISGAE